MEWIQQVLSVLLVVGLLAGGLAWLRRRGLARPAGGTGRPRNLEHLERVALAPHHSLHLIRMGGRLILVGRSPSGLTRLGTADWPGQEKSR